MPALTLGCMRGGYKHSTNPNHRKRQFVVIDIFFQKEIIISTQTELFQQQDIQGFIGLPVIFSQRNLIPCFSLSMLNR